jgi:MFS family permease
MKAVAVDRNVAVLVATVLLLGIGEELWQSFLPAYIVALGGSAAVVGLFGSCRDLLDSAYQLPGGWLSDRFGARSAIGILTATAVLGYAAYATAWWWPMLFAGLAGAMAWKAGAFPATFAVIGENVPPGARVGGFTLQSIAVRLPRVIAAPVGGFLIWRFGLVSGVRLGLCVAILLALCALIVQWRGFSRAAHVPPRGARRGIAVSLTPALRRLLVADCLVRIGEAVATSFVVLYVTDVRHVSLPIFGTLYAVQQAVALVLYVPAARLAGLIGARALIGATFAFFALFPLALLWASGPTGLLLAFIAGGCKEIGEPARKASIVDMCHEASRAREVGTYYSVRNLLVVPGGLVGGLLWERSPALVFEVAGVVSAVGLLVFAMTSRESEGDPAPQVN